ncbi:MAG: hypothetical protein D8M59_04055 [Planctomycetes bacterium]|nr:hypothetical protein [Planctomycetota bacterium]
MNTSLGDQVFQRSPGQLGAAPTVKANCRLHFSLVKSNCCLFSIDVPNQGLSYTGRRASGDAGNRFVADRPGLTLLFSAYTQTPPRQPIFPSAFSICRRYSILRIEPADDPSGDTGNTSLPCLTRNAML